MNNSLSVQREKKHVEVKTMVQVIIISVFLGLFIGLKDSILCFKRFLMAQKIHNESEFAEKRAEALLKDVEDHSLELIICGVIVSVTGIVLQIVFQLSGFVHEYVIAGVMMIAEGMMFLYLVRTDDMMKQDKGEEYVLR